MPDCDNTIFYDIHIHSWFLAQYMNLYNFGKPYMYKDIRFYAPASLVRLLSHIYCRAFPASLDVQFHYDSVRAWHCSNWRYRAYSNSNVTEIECDPIWGILEVGVLFLRYTLHNSKVDFIDKWLQLNQAIYLITRVWIHVKL